MREGDLDGVYYSISFRERTVIRSYADFKQLERLCRKANLPPLPQPPGPTESTLHATSLMEGQCVLARQLDVWLHKVARELIISSDKPANRGGPTPGKSQPDLQVYRLWRSQFADKSARRCGSLFGLPWGALPHGHGQTRRSRCHIVLLLLQR